MKQNKKKRYDFKVGTFFCIGDRHFQCVAGKSNSLCHGCALWGFSYCSIIACFSSERKDGKDVYFKEV